MRKSALWSVFGLVAAASVYLGCTQDFGQFDPTTGAGGSSSSSTTTTGGGGSGVCDHVSDCPQAGTCETVACTDHQCKTTKEDAGHACAGGFCTAGGSCVDCVTADNCGQPQECQTLACTKNKCVAKNVADETKCGQDMMLHCTGGMCTGCTGTGAGNCKMPTTACQNVTCTGGKCVPGNNDVDTACNDSGGHFCDANGACKECGTKDAECTGAHAECKAFSCTGNACVLGNASDTTACTTGGVICSGGTCVECNQPSDCNQPTHANETCTNHMCGCTPDDCGDLGLTCGPGGANGCGGMIATCDNGAPANGMETDVDCGGDITKCPTRCAKGKKCNAGTDCVAAANNCSDNVCCDTACTSICSACNLSGKVGTCSPVAKGVQNTGACDDTHGMCATGAKCACDGMDMCRKKNGEACTAGTECASGTCNTTCM